MKTMMSGSSGRDVNLQTDSPPLISPAQSRIDSYYNHNTLGFQYLPKFHYPGADEQCLPMIKKITDECYQLAWPVWPGQLESIQFECQAAADKVIVDQKRAVFKRTLPQLGVYRYFSRRAQDPIVSSI